MKKRVAALLLLALILTGCAGEGAIEPQNTTELIQTQGAAFPGLGGVMPEMTFTTADGETLTLSGLLEEKELVVLNFWFADCTWCMKEFPVMEVSYQRYRQDVEIVALNPVDGDTAVREFQEDRKYSFPMAACPRSWAVEMGIRSYPTSVFIDRDGVVCLIHTGAITSTQTFDTLFDAFTGDDYQRKIYNTINELMQ